MWHDHSQYAIGTSGLVSIYDDNVFKVSGSAISFQGGLDVSVSGSMAYVYTGETGVFDNVGIGTNSPISGLDVENTNIPPTIGKFGDDNPIYLISPDPNIGLNAYYYAGYKFGKGSASEYAAAIGFTPGDGTFKIRISNAGGNYGNAITFTTPFQIDANGDVTIATGKLIKTSGGAYEVSKASNNPTLAQHFTGTQSFTYTANNQDRHVLRFDNPDTGYTTGLIYGTVTLSYAGLETGSANARYGGKRYRIAIRDWYPGAGYPMTAVLTDETGDLAGDITLTLSLYTATGASAWLKCQVDQGSGTFLNPSYLIVHYDLVSVAADVGNFITPVFTDGSI